MAQPVSSSRGFWGSLLMLCLKTKMDFAKPHLDPQIWTCVLVLKLSSGSAPKPQNGLAQIQSYAIQYHSHYQWPVSAEGSQCGQSQLRCVISKNPWISKT